MEDLLTLINDFWKCLSLSWYILIEKLFGWLRKVSKSGTDDLWPISRNMFKLSFQRLIKF